MLRKNITYSDIPFFISKNSFTNDLNLVNDLSAIRQSVKNIIMSDLGDRAFDFDFGSGLYSTIFENLTLEVILFIQTRIANNLRNYEGRVNLNDVIVSENAEENSLQVVVDFSIPDLNINDVITIDLTRTR
jgi:phage baseplate assembly protein W